MTRESLTTSRSPGRSHSTDASERAVLECGGARPVHHQQPGGVAWLDRVLRNRLVRKGVVEVVDTKSGCVHGLESVAPGRQNRPGAIGHG